MKKFVLTAVALSAALFATSTSFADTHLTTPSPSFSRIPGTEKPLLRLAGTDYECVAAHCKAQIEACQRTRSSSDCHASEVCQQSARETGECDA